jgi:hypothetical protein
MKITPKATAAAAILNPFMTPMERVATLTTAYALSQDTPNMSLLAVPCSLGVLENLLSIRKHGFKATMKRRVKSELTTLAILWAANKLSKNKPNPHIFSLMKGNVITMSDESIHIVVLAEAIITDLGTPETPIAIKVTTSKWERLFNLDGTCATNSSLPSVIKVTH